MTKNPKRHERLIIYQAKLSSMFKLHFFIPQETLHSTTVVIDLFSTFYSWDTKLNWTHLFWNFTCL